MVSPSMLLYAVPSFVNEQEYGGGNWKAVEANRIALGQAGIAFQQVAFDPDNPVQVLENIGPGIKVTFMEYSWWPELLAEVKTQYPGVKVIVRTHNAEAYQYFHRKIVGSRREYVNLAKWRQCIRLARRDAHCRRVADILLGISEWDNSNYWRWLRGKASLRYLPYFSPWPYLRPHVDVRPWNLRQRSIVSMGGNFDPSGIANFTNFSRLGTKLSKMLDEKWSYLLTWWSQWHQNVPKVGEEVEIMRECREPWDLLCQSRALAVLTPFGFGFKTTVVDGLAAGCHVIIHPKLADRLPQQVRQLCLICDPSCERDVIKLAESLSAPPRPHGLNQHLCETVVADFRSMFS